MPSKATSKAQWRFLKAAEGGNVPTLKPGKAKEMLAGQPTPKGLPEVKGKPKKLSGQARRPTP